MLRAETSFANVFVFREDFVFPEDERAKVRSKISEFKDLPVGWHYGQGVPPTARTLDTALDLHDAIGAHHFSKTGAFPGIDGEIQVVLYGDNDCLVFTVLGDSIEYARERNKEEIAYEGAINLTRAFRIIQDYQEEIWRLYVSSIPNFTITSEGTSAIWRLNALATERAYPLLKPIVSASWNTHPARISANTMRSSMESHRYIGGFHKQFIAV